MDGNTLKIITAALFVYYVVRFILIMRFKVGSSTRNPEWECLFCINVRTATIILGIWHLILHILALAILALMMRNQYHIEQIQSQDDFEPSDFLPTPLSKIKGDENPYYLPTKDGRAVYSSDLDMGALMTLCTLSITLLMVYGAIKGKAFHILPFFCLQVFDLAISIMTSAGYFVYLRSMQRLIEEHWHSLPFKEYMSKMSPQMSSFLLLMGLVLSLVWKGYCLSIVWRCYKYLTLREQTRNIFHYIIQQGGEDPMSLPDTETAFYGNSPIMMLKQTPPPSYQDVMGEVPPPPYPQINQTGEGVVPMYHFVVMENQARLSHNTNDAVNDVTTVQVLNENAEASSNNNAESSETPLQENNSVSAGQPAAAV